MFDTAKARGPENGLNMVSRNRRVSGNPSRSNPSIPNKKDLTVNILLANLRSLPSKFLELQVTIENTNPSVVVLTESWMIADMEDAEFSIYRYSLLRQDWQSESKTRGGGVALYIRSDVKYYRCESLCKSKGLEALFVLATFKIRNYSKSY